MKTNWNRDYLKGYLLLYCANADLNLTEQEMGFIRSKVRNLDLDNVKEEFENDSDYESLEKIQSAYRELGYSVEDRDNLLSEIKDLFNHDGEFDQVENYIQHSLERLFN